MNVENIKLQTIQGSSDTINGISYFIADTDDVAGKVVSLMYTPAEG